MIPVELQIGLILVAAGGAGYLTWRPLRSRVLSSSGVRIGLGLVALLGLALGTLAGIGLYRFHHPATGSRVNTMVSTSEASITRGERLAHLCITCHASDGRLPLDGGTTNITPGIGRLYAPNLTPGGTLARWTDEEIARAIRAGVHRSGRSLLIMPSHDYRYLSDRDLASIVAFLRSQPAVPRDVPATALNLIGAAVIATGVFPLSAEEAPPVPPSTLDPAAPATPEYGQYLVRIAGCGTCHGDDLQGGTDEFVPTGPPLPPVLAHWRVDEFVRALRTGKRPSGRLLDPKLMPWRDYAAAFTDEELRAMYAYIRSLAAPVAREQKNTPVSGTP